MVAKLVLGIFAIVAWGHAPAPATYANPLIDGIVVRQSWRDLEPKPGVFDWSQLDAIFAAAARAHKRVHLVVAARADAPQFVIDDPEQSYDVQWIAFQSRLAQRYGDNPALALVTVTGPHGSDVDAWKKTIAFFCSTWKSPRIVFELSSRSFSHDALRELAAWGVTRYGPHFALQAKDGDRFATLLIERFSRKVLTGVELRRVRSARAGFVEIDERDANDPALAPAISKARAAMNTAR